MPELVHPILNQKLVLLTSTAVLAWCLFTAISAQLWPWGNAQLASDARNTAAALFLSAGALRMARWRLTGEAEAAFSAAALIVLGASSTALSFLGPTLQPSHQLPASPALKLVILAPVLALLIAGLRSAPVRAGVHPGWLSAVGIAACAAVLVGLTYRPIAGSTVMNSPAIWEAGECIAAALWAMIAIGTWNRGRRDGRVTRLWSASAMLLMAVAEALRGVSIVVPGSLLAAAAGFQLIAAAVAMTATATELCDVYSAHGSRTLHLFGGMDAAQQRLHVVEERQRERLHDARSAIVGVLGASSLLAHPTELLSPEQLYRMMTAELHRLNRVLDSDEPDQIRQFHLGQTIEAVLLAHRLSGGVVRTGDLDRMVLGRPAVTATVIANLLANVRNYAPGAAVWITAHEVDETVTIRVDDNGPGIASCERDRVLLRGERGADSAAVPGSGLGLYTSSVAMVSQSGSLRLETSPAGGTRVQITLPSAGAAIQYTVQAQAS
ncbi:MAG TPA: HAMP domain-containing sensor histidine kinase [Jatrophihabitans sp.]